MPERHIIDQIHALVADQGRALRETISEGESQLASLIGNLPDERFERIYLLGCGTSFHAVQGLKYVYEEMTGLPTEGIEAFAFAAYHSPLLLSKKTLVIGFSTSGDTAAVVESLVKAQARGAWTIGVTALATSEVGRRADAVLLTGAPDEVSMPRTKAQSQGLVALYLLAIRLGQKLGHLSADQADRLVVQLGDLIPAVVRTVAEREAQIRSLAETYRECSTVFVVGSGPNAGTALTGALMITEMAKIHCLGDELENFLHGRLREVDQSTPFVVLSPKGAASARTLDFLTVAAHVKAPTIILTDEVSPGIRGLASHIVELPGGILEIFTPILYITPLHLLANHLAVAMGKDPLDRRYNDIVPTTVRYQGT